MSWAPAELDTDGGGVVVSWRPAVSDEEVVALTVAVGGHREPGWWDRVRVRSLGWVAAREPDGGLVGFVNVAWDGGDHAFLLDTMIAPARQKQGMGTRVVRLATAHARRAGCEWLHVDFGAPLRAFYLGACGFRPTDAGLVHLR